MAPQMNESHPLINRIPKSYTTQAYVVSSVYKL